jgi:hypothetical protein
MLCYLYIPGLLNSKTANKIIISSILYLHCIAVLPDTSGGFNRSEFERNLRDNLLVYFTAMFPPEREEDVFNAINWYYSPWPHVDDVYANREAFNFVSATYTLDNFNPGNLGCVNTELWR